MDRHHGGYRQLSQNKDHPTVSLDLARIVIRYASDCGLDGRVLWRSAGLPPRLLQSGDARISARRFAALWRAVEEKTGEDHFGIRLGSALKDYAAGHLLIAVLMNSQTVGAALGKFCRYHCIMSNAVQPRLTDTAESPKIVVETVHPEMILGLGHEAFIFSLFASMVEFLTGSRENIREIRFAHPPPKTIDSFRLKFACPTIFNCRDSELLLAKDAMDRPVFLANAHTLSGLENMALTHMEQLSSENTARYRAACTLGRMLMKGEKPTIGAAVKALGMSTRRLQQVLRSERTGYREILDQVRKESAIRLLEDMQNTISDITFILGFSEQSSFTHAFQKWTGQTPGLYRKSGGG